MSEVTRLIERVCEGEEQAAEDLLPLIYDELRRLAQHNMNKESPGQTLQATALVHEAWLRLVGSDQNWRGRRHFFNAAAVAMRRILIERARKRGRARHGANAQHIDLNEIDVAASTPDESLFMVDEALTRFAQQQPDKAELVRLRYYIGLSISDAAQALGISESTAKRQWNFARAWLYRELQKASE